MPDPNTALTTGKSDWLSVPRRVADNGWKGFVAAAVVDGTLEDAAQAVEREAVGRKNADDVIGQQAGADTDGGHR